VVCEVYFGKRMTKLLDISIQLPSTCSHALAPPFGGGLLGGGGSGGAANLASMSLEIGWLCLSSSFSASLDKAVGEGLTVC
jgi:hypothetical protein